MLQRPIIVQKFGGTSVGSIGRIEKVADRIAERYQSGESPVVIVSAMSGQTNKLIEMAHQVMPAYRGDAYDMLLASGEQVSVSLLSMALRKRSIESKPLLAHQVGIHTDSHFSKAQIKSIDTTKIRKIIRSRGIPLIAGFQGVTERNQITTLGRGGSDLTAVTMAKALKQRVCEIYTDVSGVFTADPDLVPTAGKLDSIDFLEMMEMSFSGSKVLQLQSVEMASKHNLNIHVRHAFQKGEGTWILKSSKIRSPITAITHDMNTLMIRLQNLKKGSKIVSNIFGSLGRGRISVDIISQSEWGDGQNISFSITEENLEPCLKILENFFDTSKISVISDVAKISIVGVGMINNPGIAAKFFSVFQKERVNLYIVTTSEIKISAVIDRKHITRIAKLLHKEFSLE